jgi:hypothetical protein
VQFGLVKGLLNTKIYRAGDEFQAVQQVVRKHPIGLKIASEDLDVNGSGQAEIENLADDIRGQEIKGDAGEILGEFDAQFVNVLGGGMMILGKFGEDIGVARTDRRGIAVGKIDTAVRQADIVNQTGQFGLRNLFADDCFDLVAERGGFFDARAGGSAHVQFEFAAVHFREKVLPEERKRW